MKHVELQDEAPRRLEPILALEEAGRRAERAQERAAAARLHAQQVEPQLFDRIKVEREERQRVEVFNARHALGEADAERGTKADARNRGERAPFEVRDDAW